MSSDKLIQQGTKAVIGVVVAVTLSYMAATGQEIPSEMTNLLLIVIGGQQVAEALAHRRKENGS